MARKVEEYWVWIAMNEDGDEGGVAYHTGDGTLVVLCTSQEDRLPELEPLARQLSADMGVPLKLVKFTAPVIVKDLRN